MLRKENTLYFYFCSRFSTFLKLRSTILSSQYTFIPHLRLGFSTNTTCSLVAFREKLFSNTLSALFQAESSQRAGTYSTLRVLSHERD